jgi:hypothetical protein
MVQIGMAGEDISFPKIDCSFACVNMKQFTRIIGGKKFLEMAAEAGNIAAGQKYAALVINQLDRNVNAFLESFHHFLEMFFFYNGI